MKSTYSTPLSQYLFCSCHKMFRLRHFEVDYIFRLYPISHSWNTLLLFQSLLVWFTAPLAIFWNGISWNLRHGPPKGSYSDAVYYSIRLFLRFSFSDATIVSTFWQSCPFEIKSILTICLSLPHYPVGQGEQTSFLSLSSPLFVFLNSFPFQLHFLKHILKQWITQWVNCLWGHFWCCLAQSCTFCTRTFDDTVLQVQTSTDNLVKCFELPPGF